MFGSLVINFVERGDWKNAGHGRTETGADPGREKWLQRIPHRTALQPMTTTPKTSHFSHGENPAPVFLKGKTGAPVPEW